MRWGSMPPEGATDMEGATVGVGEMSCALGPTMGWLGSSMRPLEISETMSTMSTMNHNAEAMLMPVRRTVSKRPRRQSR